MAAAHCCCCNGSARLRTEASAAALCQQRCALPPGKCFFFQYNFVVNLQYAGRGGAEAPAQASGEARLPAAAARSPGVLALAWLPCRSYVPLGARCKGRPPGGLLSQPVSPVHLGWHRPLARRMPRHGRKCKSIVIRPGPSCRLAPFARAVRVNTESCFHSHSTGSACSALGAYRRTFVFRRGQK